MQLSVVILAAGQGQRMKSDLPKVLQPLAGRPLLSHVIDAALNLAPQRIHVVYGHGGSAVREVLAEAPVDWVLQAEQLGTGHAMMQAMPHIPNTHCVLVLYGDVPLIRTESLRALVEAAGSGDLALLTANVADSTGYGRIVRNPSGQVSAIVEHRDANPEQRRIPEINTGLMAAPAARLRSWLSSLRNDNAQREYYLTDVVAAAVAEGCSVDAVVAASEGEVLGVNDKLQLAEAEAIYRRDRARELMTAGATLADPARIDVRGQVTVGRDVFIDVNAVFLGTVTLADRVTIGPNCVLRDVAIGPGTVVHGHCFLEAATIGADCSIGPFARMRPHATLHDNVHVGNFVEIKNSELGERTKANHLSYVGDTRIGKDVNVGAGTITCNYDGVNKWPTTIEDGAFIGSGSMLVAPVRVGAKATIGAGSTIVGNAPDDKLTLTRARQTTVEGWTRPTKADEQQRAARIALAGEKPKP